MTTTVVTTKGQIVIPYKIRHKFNIEKGTRVSIEERDGELVITPVTPEYFKKMAGSLGTKGKLSRALLEERARDKKREA
ncbi:MAG TPA: AbrB/MazE/SpoVT family DNA-binding domain-containing protein [Candidatus Bathyarchaeia archaeon]|nr:AbrB/MazE/SpoVT family DNA-binding domain-containing protein [Candidatus Bathyarchaeia archaeon]